jgi:Protein of unknown function (DUF3298)
VNRNLLVGFVSAAMICGAVGCGAPSTPPPHTAAPTQGVPPACANLGGTVDTDQMCHVRSSGSDYTLEMRYPIDYPDQQAVSDYLAQSRERFTGWVVRFGPKDHRGRAYTYNARAKTFRSGSPTAGTVSLVLEIDDDTGFVNEGHPDTTFKAFNYDLTRHAPITFDTLFKPGTQPLKVLNPIIQRKLVLGSDYRIDDLDESAYQNFAITNDAVIFFFGQNQVVHDHAGPHRVSVPRTELAALLA